MTQELLSCWFAHNTLSFLLRLQWQQSIVLYEAAM